MEIHALLYRWRRFRGKLRKRWLSSTFQFTYQNLISLVRIRRIISNCWIKDLKKRKGVIVGHGVRRNIQTRHSLFLEYPEVIPTWLTLFYFYAYGVDRQQMKRKNKTLVWIEVHRKVCQVMRYITRELTLFTFELKTWENKSFVSSIADCLNDWCPSNNDLSAAGLLSLKLDPTDKKLCLPQLST